MVLKNKCLQAIICLFVLLPIMGFAQSELPEYVLKQLHNDITYTVITERNLDKIDEIVESNRQKHFVVVQADASKFSDEDGAKLMQWVKNGGVLWFSDSRLARYFGMENSPVDPEADKLTYKDYNGGYGTGKVPGISIIAHANPAVDHPIKTGVQAVQVFLMDLGDKKYSCVKGDTPGVIPVFVLDLKPRAAVALKKTGKGWVLFKPLLWPKVLGGERFQVNLKEFSAGYPVPEPGKNVVPMEAFQGKPVKLDRYDSLILSDGQQVIGCVAVDELEFMGPDGTLKKKIGEIESISFLPAKNEVVLKSGERFDGFLMTMAIKFKTIAGKTIDIDKENITRINFDVGNNIPDKGL